MQKNYRIGWTALLVGLTTLFACSRIESLEDKEKPPVVDDNKSDDQAPKGECIPEGTEPQVFDLAPVVSLMNSDCVSCHGPSGSFPDLSTEALIVQYKAQIIDSVVKSRMPKGQPYASGEKLDLIEAWQSAASLTLNLASFNTPPVFSFVSEPANAPTYLGTIKGIIDQKCTTCHNPNYGQTPYLRDYNEVTNNAQRSKSRMEDAGDPMPPAGAHPLAANELTLFNTWIANETPEGEVLNQIPVGVQPGYNDWVSGFLQNTCAGCHNQIENEGVPYDFDNFNGAKVAANAGLAAMKNGTMPPKGPLPNGPNSEIAQFESWITANFPLNDGDVDGGSDTPTEPGTPPPAEEPSESGSAVERPPESSDAEKDPC